ncbi:MAG: hypothetical protein ACERKD_12775 [Prolixibacteraceae bacterium]
MEQKEKQILVSLGTSILTMIFYWMYVYRHQVVMNPDTLNNFQFWGKTLLIFIPVAIVAQIIIHILFAIVNKIFTNEDMQDKSDERDKLIELKAIRISHWIFITGFFMAMLSQAISLAPSVMFISLIVAGFASAVISDIAKIFMYRRGV